MIFHGVDVIEKIWSSDFGPGGDSFAGLDFHGGIQGFLSHHYKALLAENYEEYRLQHNQFRRVVPVSQIVDFLVNDPRRFARPPWLMWERRVRLALAEYKPMAHIPLLP